MIKSQIDQLIDSLKQEFGDDSVQFVLDEMGYLCVVTSDSDGYKATIQEKIPMTTMTELTKKFYQVEDMA